MIYLDNAATTMPKPPQVAEAVANAINSYGNPSRGSYEASLDGVRCMLQARLAAAELFGAANPMNVAFTQNATAAINIAVGGIKGHIVMTAAEHNSVLRPVFRRGNYTVVPLDEKGRLDVNDIKNAIKPDTEAVVMCHASNLTGNVFDIAAVGAVCREKGVRFILDAAQTAGLLPVNMTEIGISALCFSGHKSLYGPQGTGGICLGEGYRPQALVVGGSGSDSFSPAHPTVMPDALEAGTQNSHGVAGLLAGINYVKSMEGRVFADADRLARMFAEEMKKTAHVVLYGDIGAKLRTPVVSLNIEGIDSGEVASVLNEKYGVAVRAGAHCAPLMHKTLGTEKSGAVRFSFSHFNTEEELYIAVDGVKDIAKRGGFFYGNN